ncbi:MAG: hypothetical protein ACKOCM_06960 [Cyanobacteriota bacterium]
MAQGPGWPARRPELRNNHLLIDGRLARRPQDGQPWVIRCVAGTVEAPGCRYRTLAAALQASRSNDLVLLGRGGDLNLQGASLPLLAGVQLLAARSAPVLPTQWGKIRLADLLPAAITPVQQGVLELGGGNRLVGLRFNGISLRQQPDPGRHPTEIRGNHFLGSYSDNPGGISPVALPTLWLKGGTGAVVIGNSFERPEVRSLESALGWNDNRPAALVSVCGSSSSKRSKRPPGIVGTCLSGNAIRLEQSGASRVIDNRISEALDEAIRIENPRGPIEVAGNQIEAMRQGPDSNMQAAIFTRVSQGSARVSIHHNRIGANAIGILEPADGPLALRGGLRQVLDVRNLIDPIEIGLCRGDHTFPRADDKYGDPAYGTGDCQSRAQLRLDVIGNRIQPGRQSDADGIDYNIGRGGKLIARTMANDVSEIGEGNSAYTVDLRGNGEMRETIRANHLVADNGISLEIGNLNGVPMNLGRLKAAIDDNTILADTQSNPRLVNGKPQDNEASGLELEVQGSNTAAAGFHGAVTLHRNRITVINQPGNPASDAVGIRFGSVLFKAKDGTILQRGRLLSGRLALSLTANQVSVTHGAGSGRGSALDEVIEQGHFERVLTIGPGNIWLLNGSSINAIHRAPAFQP